MESKEYIARALQTESKPATAAITAVGLDILFSLASAHAEVMNRIKRAMFYGKPLEKEELLQALANVGEGAHLLAVITSNDALQDEEALQNTIKIEDPELTAMDVSRVNLRLLHGVIGQASENGEKMEALQKQLRTGEFDLVNYCEEMGDDSWYDAIQKDELMRLAAAEAEVNNVAEVFDASEAGIRTRNVLKLEKRNKGKQFNAEATLNRDTDAERVILESTFSAPV